MAKILLTFLSGAVGRLVTIHNDKPLLDVDGNYVDAHDGMILEHDQTYFLYGEAYGNQTLATQYPWHAWPRLAVYTSQDLVSWTYGGPVLTREQVGGTLWIPNVFFHGPTQRFILWYGAGDWGTATSTDGVHFELHEPHHTSRLGGSTDGTGIFIDDDGAGYVIFAASPAGVPTKLGQGHVVSIERLTSDLLKSSKVNVSDYFPDDYVESPALFKRRGWYYVTYGSCCCGCAEGGGQVVHKSRSVLGPWVRQRHADINCRDSSALVCGGFGRRNEQLKDLVYNAQWWGASVIPSSDPTAEPAIVYTGRRWLSGPNLPAGCNDICGNRGHPKKCLAGGEKFEMRRDYSVWYPLEFDDATGDIKPMQHLSSVQLDIPGDDPVPSPTPPPTPSPPSFEALYRCTNAQGHFLSTSNNCDGGHVESQMGCLETTPVAGTTPLYQCLNLGSDLFPSLHADCEGQALQTKLGYVYSSSSSAASRALYRCQIPGPDHFASLVSNCEGQTNEGLLGYIASSCSSSTLVVA